MDEDGFQLMTTSNFTMEPNVVCEGGEVTHTLMENSFSGQRNWKTDEEDISNN